MKKSSRKVLLITGVLLVALGIASLFVPIPQQQEHGISIGSVDLGVSREVHRPVDPAISATLIVLGVVGVIVGLRR